MQRNFAFFTVHNLPILTTHISAPKVENNAAAIYRLTALWAFCEAGLGGVMFALHIPLTGLILGAFSIIILSLIANYSEHPFSSLLRATVLVLMVKAMAAPHSSPAAYLAVGFQGFLAAFLFAGIRLRSAACLLLGTLSMLESALQKLIVLTVIFGATLWKALAELTASVATLFHLAKPENASQTIIISYVAIFAVWGGVVGYFAIGLPKILEDKKPQILAMSEALPINNIKATPRKKGSNLWRRSIVFLVLLLITILFGVGSQGNIFYTFSRSLVVVFFIFAVLQPAITYLVNRWLANRSGQEKESALALLQTLPQTNTLIRKSWLIAGKQSNFIQKIHLFIVASLVLSIYEK